MFLKPDAGFGLTEQSFEHALAQLRSVGQRVARQEVGVEGLTYMVKLFLPDSFAKWIICHADGEDSRLLWGLADLGLDIVEYGPVPLQELIDLRGQLGCRVQMDLFFHFDGTFGELQQACKENSRIIF